MSNLKIQDPIDIVGHIVIDVRRPDEFNNELGHIEGSKLVTLGEELDSFLKSTSKDQKIIFVCRSGARSACATSQAQEAGFTNVFNLEGGMIYWNEKHFPVVRE